MVKIQTNKRNKASRRITAGARKIKGRVHSHIRVGDRYYGKISRKVKLRTDEFIDNVGRIKRAKR